jgi:ATP-dependent RNA helicase DeaD
VSGTPALAAAVPAEAPQKAAETFDALPLSAELRETLAEIGYTHPTPVQLAVWEPATRGRDAVVQARTGTGKTAAFAIPIVDHLVKRSLGAAQVLILCPTRELALQVAAEVGRLGKRKGVSVAAVYGGASMSQQVEAIAAGAHVIVGTPGRVLDHLRRGTLAPKAIHLLVLDESDEMLSMGFEREISAILEHLPKQRQTLLFSATLPPDIERLAQSKLRSPELLTLSGDHIGALEVQHFVYMVASDKTGALLRILEVENPQSAVIFCNTKDETELVTQALKRRGFDADWLNGDLPQSEREKVMAATREGHLRFLVATDVAARGIDISHLTHVINFDFPMDAESYVHRTGRTGRAGHAGAAISLVTPHDIGNLYILRLTYKIRPLEKQIPTEGELKTRAEADLVTMLAETFIPRGAHPDDVALARRILSHDDCERILAGLLRTHLGERAQAQEHASAARRAPEPRRPVAPAAPAVHAGERRAQPPPSPGGQPLPESATKTSGGTGRGPRGAARDTGPQGRPERERMGERRSSPRRELSGDRPRATQEPVMPRPAAAAPTNKLAAESAPVTGAERVFAPAPRHAAPAPVRHSDFTTWQPPEEEGDDEPILQAPAPSALLPRTEAPEPDLSAVREAQHRGPDTSARDRGGESREEDFVELFLNVGRRDGVRAADLQRMLLERAGLSKDNIKRIRVRERNAFLSVRKADAERAIAGFSGVTMGGRPLAAEQARGRSPASADADDDSPGPDDGSA